MNSIATPWKHATASADNSAAILAVIRAGAQTRGNAATLRRALRDKATLFRDFNHFNRLCIGDLRDAYLEDRQNKTRQTKNRRLTWLAMYRHFAAHANIDKDLEIQALDRQGNYICRLVERAPPDEWDKLLHLANAFGITEQDLNTLLRSKQTRAA